MIAAKWHGSPSHEPTAADIRLTDRLVPHNPVHPSWHMTRSETAATFLRTEPRMLARWGPCSNLLSHVRRNAPEGDAKRGPRDQVDAGDDPSRRESWAIACIQACLYATTTD
jgi:hypothetical protein